MLFDVEQMSSIKAGLSGAGPTAGSFASGIDGVAAEAEAEIPPQIGGAGLCNGVVAELRALAGLADAVSAADQSIGHAIAAAAIADAAAVLVKALAPIPGSIRPPAQWTLPAPTEGPTAGPDVPTIDPPRPGYLEASWDILLGIGEMSLGTANFASSGGADASGVSDGWQTYRSGRREMALANGEECYGTEPFLGPFEKKSSVYDDTPCDDD